MATWLMLLLCMFEGYAPPDYEEIDYPALKAARESYKSQLALINLQKAAAVEKKTQTISLQHVVSATEGPTVHYLVTGPNCVPCVKRKAYLQSVGAVFTEISVEEARSMGQVVTYIPVEFDKASTVSATVVAVDAPPSANALLFVVQDHLLAQCEGHTYASFFQFDVDVPDSLPTLINQLMDAGTLANMQGGFIGKGLRLRGGPMRFQPGEWKPVDATGEDLARNIVPIPTKEASPTLFNMLGMLIESTNDLASVKDVMSGDMPANTPATTVLAMIEQGQKSFNAIYKRIWRSLTEELRKLFKLNGIYLDPQEYLNIIDEPQADPQSDFEMDGRDIIPVADPAVSSNAQRMAQSQAAMSVSGRPGVNEALLTNDYLKSIGHTKADMIAPYDPQEQEQAKAQAMQQAQQQQEMQQSVIQAQAQKELFDSHMKEREMALKEAELDLKREKQESDEEMNEAKIQQIVISTIQQVLQVAPGLLIPGAQMIQPAVESAEEKENERPEQPEFDYRAMGGMETPPGNGIGDGAIDGASQPSGVDNEGAGAFSFPESAYDASGLSPDDIEQVGLPSGIDGAD